MPSLTQIINTKLETINKKLKSKSFEFRVSSFEFQVKKGFTLIELLVVITIIAILIAAASASWSNAQMKSRDGRRKSDLKSVQQALEMYMQTNGKYPNSTSGKITCNTIAPDTDQIEWGNPFVCDSAPSNPITYNQQLPKDPAYQTDASKGYYYSSASPFLTYVLSAELENDNDKDRITTGVPCTPQGYPSRDFCVINP